MNEEIKELLETKEEENATWEELIDNSFVHGINAKVVRNIEIDVTTKEWLDIFEELELTDKERAEVIIAIEDGDYKAEYYESDNPRNDMVTLYINDLEIELI